MRTRIARWVEDRTAAWWAPFAIAALFVSSLFADGGDDDGSDDGDEDGDDDGDADEMVPQSEVDEISTRSRNKGLREGKRALLKELGFTSIADAKAALDDTDDDDDDDEGDEDRGRARSRRRDDRAREARARDRETAAEVRSSIADSLIGEGVRDRDAGRVVAAEVFRVATDGGADLDISGDDIDDALEEVRDRMPYLFADDGSSDNPDRDDDAPASRRRRGSSGDRQRRRRRSGRSLSERGRDLAREAGWVDDDGKEIPIGTGGRAGRVV